MNTKITNCRKNTMGTASFDGLFPSMRKAEDFIVYPMQDSGTEIRIQSDHRYGRIDLDSGKGILSARRAQYANGTWLLLCQMHRTAVAFELSTEERETLRQWIKSTGGLLVGSSILKCDNTGALAL